MAAEEVVAVLLEKELVGVPCRVLTALRLDECVAVDAVGVIGGGTLVVVATGGGAGVVRIVTGGDGV